MKMVAIALLSAFAAAALSACGEKPTVTTYRQGTYQGKPDNLPWQSGPFNGSQVEWEKAIKARNVSQNEYVRVENQ
jgi:hypothetical protein